MSIRTHITSLLIPAFLASAGCLALEDQGETSGESTRYDRDGNAIGWADLDDCKIEGSDIGRDGVGLDIGRVRVTFEEWIPKDGSPGEYAGFRLSLRGAASLPYRVKTGGQVHRSDENVWIHPNGTSGSSVPAISNVNFCENPPNTGDGNDGDVCNDPDGCDNGNGGGGNDGDVCNDPDGCDNGNGGGGNDGDVCNDPDGCDRDPRTCTADSQCGYGEFCSQGVCVPNIG